MGPPRVADVLFRAAGSYTNFNNAVAPGQAFDVYTGDHSAIVLLANAYVDLGTWWCLTPFVGGGVGAAYHRISNLQDIGINSNGLGASAFGYAPADHTQWNLAWALHAGVAYTVSQNFKMQLAYRYLNMGSVDTAEVLCGATGCGTGAGPRAFYTLKDFTSQDIMLGMRWMITPDQPSYMPPLMRKG